jgi:flagellar biosynthesis/type III secretory pathway chaperone
MSISTIKATLQQQLKLYEELLELENSKKDLILINDVVQLNVVTQKEKLLTAQAENLEQGRMLMTARYFIDNGFRDRSGLLSDLIKLITNSDDKLYLLQLHEDLTKVLSELKFVNDSNQQLIRQSLDFINFSIELMVDDPNEDLVYRHPMKQLGNNKNNKLFDSRA